MNHRRNFLKKMILAVGAIMAWPAGMVRAKKVAINLGKAEKLKTVGGSMILKVKGRAILFIRDSGESIRALDPTCTHQKCQVAYNAEESTIDCPCHGSRFNMEGKVLAGPAPDPLETYPAYMDDKDRIIITIEEAE